MTSTFYAELKATGAKIEHHESDLYTPDTPEARELAKRHNMTGVLMVPFRHQASGTPWLDFPFAYAPFWDKVARRAEVAQ